MLLTTTSSSTLKYFRRLYEHILNVDFFIVPKQQHFTNKYNFILCWFKFLTFIFTFYGVWLTLARIKFDFIFILSVNTDFVQDI